MQLKNEKRHFVFVKIFLALSILKINSYVSINKPAKAGIHLMVS